MQKKRAQNSIEYHDFYRNQKDTSLNFYKIAATELLRPFHRGQQWLPSNHAIAGVKGEGVVAIRPTTLNWLKALVFSSKKIA